MEEFFALLGFFASFADIISLLMIFLEPDRDGNYTRLQYLGLFLLGILIGLVSLHIFSKPMMLTSGLKVTAALAAPFLAGIISEYIADYVSRRKDDVWPRRHFWYAFWVTLGCILVRLIASSNY